MTVGEGYMPVREEGYETEGEGYVIVVEGYVVLYDELT